MQDICIKGSDVKKVYEQMNFGTALCSKSQKLLIDMCVLFSTRLTLKQLCDHEKASMTNFCSSRMWRKCSLHVQNYCTCSNHLTLMWICTLLILHLGA